MKKIFSIIILLDKIANRLFRIMLKVFGTIFLMLLILAFTDNPFWLYYRLGVSEVSLVKNPTHIVVMGGEGMPSPGGLMRCYAAAKNAGQFPEANIIIAMPTDKKYFQDSHAKKMAKEIQARGVDSVKILFETKGINTYTQVHNIALLYPGIKDTGSILIITSPEHVYRCLKVFRKAGFKNVSANALFEIDIDPALLSDKKKKESKKELFLRYNFWTQLRYEIILMREYAAIAYYWLKGWI